VATGVGRREILTTSSDSPGPKMKGISANSAQLSFTGTELYRFEVSINRDAIFFKNWGKIGETLSDFYPKQTRFYFSGPELLCKMSSKSNQNCGRMSVYGQTDRMTDRRK